MPIAQHPPRVYRNRGVVIALAPSYEELLQHSLAAVEPLWSKYPKTERFWSLLITDPEAIANWDMSDYLTTNKLNYNDHGMTHAVIAATNAIRIVVLLAEAGVDVEQLVAESTTKPLPPIDEVEAAIAKLTRKMEAMEPVNMRAIDEYNQVLERKTDFAGKIDTLTREREAITMRISGYQDLKRLSFQQAFDSVAGHFKSLYADLAEENEEKSEQA